MLIAPNNVEVASRLMDLGLFRVLQEEGVSIQQAPSIELTTTPLLPITKFGSTTEAED